MVDQSGGTSKGQGLRDGCKDRILPVRRATRPARPIGKSVQLGAAEGRRRLKSPPHGSSAHRKIWLRFRREASGLRVTYATRKSAIKDRPVTVPEFLATICAALGINYHKQNVS